MILRILAEAEAEIEAAQTYLNGQSAGLGNRFLDELSDRLDAIAEQPLTFAKLRGLTDDSPYRRALLNTFRYAVIFECVADETVIMAVTHTSRLPNYWLGRRA